MIKHKDDKQKALSFLKEAIINENTSQENLIFQLMKAKYLKNIDQQYEAYQILNKIKQYLDDNGLYELAILADSLENTIMFLIKPCKILLLGTKTMQIF